MELENFVLCETKPCHSTSIKLYFEQEWKTWPFVLMLWSLLSFFKGVTLLLCCSYPGHFLELNADKEYLWPTLGGLSLAEMGL